MSTDMTEMDITKLVIIDRGMISLVLMHMVIKLMAETPMENTTDYMIDKAMLKADITGKDF